jgi:general secretion pathway protein G
MDPWGRPYVYFPFPPSKGKGGAPPAGARKDRFLVPINSRYDLYSTGKDGGSAAPLTAKSSRDDIVVANDGGFVGRASKF